MGRRQGSRAGRVLPGLAAAMIARYQSLDRSFHLPPSCYWCAQVAGLKAGQPVEVEASSMHEFLDHDEFQCSGRWKHDDSGTYRVTGDRYERLA